MDIKSKSIGLWSMVLILASLFIYFVYYLNTVQTVKPPASSLTSPTPVALPSDSPILSPTLPTTGTRQDMCRSSGGVWKEFPNTCADKCGSQPACGEAMTDSCDCGADKCWDGSRCIPNIPFDNTIQ